MKLLTMTQVAELTGIKRRTLYNMIRDKRFPVEPVKGTKPRLWNEEEVKKWVNQ